MAVIIVIWSFIYAMSFGFWTWKRKNRIGAVVVAIIAFAALILPMYLLAFK